MNKIAKQENELTSRKIKSIQTKNQFSRKQTIPQQWRQNLMYKNKSTRNSTSHVQYSFVQVQGRFIGNCALLKSIS